MLIDVLAGRKIHHRIGSVVNRRMQFFQFAFDVAGHGTVADVGVDLAFGSDPDAHRFQLFGKMVDVGRDHHPTGCNFVANQFGRKVFTFGHKFHFGCDFAGSSFQNLSRHRVNSPIPYLLRRIADWCSSPGPGRW